MPLVIRSYLRGLVADLPFWERRQQVKEIEQLEAWDRAGKQTPPPHLAKQRILAAYGLAFSASIFIETGTFRGDMVYAMKDRFQAVYSIELSAGLCKLAQRRFRQYPNVRILQGDSGALLPALLAEVSGICLLWLDGHYSAGETAFGGSNTPVINELNAALDDRNTNPVILIDDARCFDGSNDYPTLAQVQDLVAEKRPAYECHVLHDVIRIHPKGNVRSDF